MAQMPENAPVIVLLFLLTLAVLAAATAFLLWSLGQKRLRRVRRILEGMAVIVLIYSGTLLTYSLTSREKVLEPGQEKYFCELDCHLAYSVANVSTGGILGKGRDQRSAGGVFYVVTVRTWFDESTISPRRGNSPLWPNPRQVVVADRRGRVFFPSREGSRALASEGKAGIPLDHPLRPGESYSTSLVFDLPPDVDGPRLLNLRKPVRHALSTRPREQLPSQEGLVRSRIRTPPFETLSPRPGGRGKPRGIRRRLLTGPGQQR